MDMSFDIKSYHEGYDDGYNHGYDTGFEDGYNRQKRDSEVIEPWHGKATSGE